MVKQVSFCGEKAYCLESEAVSCICIPRRGGKLASIKLKETGFELLFQNPKSYYSDADNSSRFENFEACGFDDVFPSIDAEIVDFNGSCLEYPDHGELWTADFDCSVQSEEITLSYKSKLFDYSVKKVVSVKDNEIKCAYSIKNNGKESFPCFYAMHCLVNIEDEMRIIFPDGTDEILNVLKSERLGKEGTVYAFPKDAATAGVYDFSSVNKCSHPTMDKYYVVGAVKKGKCGYEYTRSGVRALIEYDHKSLPYLGFWITQGGFRGDYNCALEPTNGYYDSIGSARRNNKCPLLEQGNTMEFEIRISLEKIERK